MLKTGLVSITFRELSAAKIVKLVKQACLDGIEWGGDKHVPHGDMAKARSVRKLCEENGILIPAYGSYYKAGCSEKEGLSFSSVFDCACELGAATIRVWAGRTGSQEATPAIRKQIILDLQRISEIALGENLSISLEYHSGTLTDNNLSAGALMQELKHNNILFYWQPPIGLNMAKCLQSLKTILPRLGNIHVFNWELDNKGNLQQFPLAEGAEFWQHYFSEIEKNKPQPEHYAMLEFVKEESQKQFFEDAATLKHIILGISR